MLTRFGHLCPDLDKFEHILNIFEQIWTFLNRFGQFRTYLDNFVQIWTHLNSPHFQEKETFEVLFFLSPHLIINVKIFMKEF